MTLPPLLTDREWDVGYDSSADHLVREFYGPALRCAVRYDRVTGFFTAGALALAGRGIAGVAVNKGKARMIVGCRLDPPEVAALAKGEELKAVVARKLAETEAEIAPTDALQADVLELLAHLVATGTLEVRVAVPCDLDKNPVAGTAMFHQKAGIIADREGNVLAFNGSINETEQGWTKNIESFNVFTSFGGTGAHVLKEIDRFEKLWADKAKNVRVVDVPTAVREKLLQFMPKDGELPKLLHVPATKPQEPKTPPAAPPPAEPVDWAATRRLAWGIVQHAPALPDGGERVGEATANIEPWPHQIRAFQRMYEQWPPKLLIADEVGLGKTIEAGLLLRQAWLSGRAKRILILAPRAVRKQWQIELREKFNLNWPIYDGAKLRWYESAGLPEGQIEREVSRADWHKEPFVIASSHLMRRKGRAPELVEQAEPYDLIVLDEAHHARRRGAGSASMKGPNLLLQLMQKLVARTSGLLLLTATPMQVHPVEVYDLLKLLGMPPEWSEGAFQQYFDILGHENPGHHDVENLVRLFKAVEAFYGPTPEAAVTRFVESGSKLATKRILGALRDEAKTKRQTMSAADRAVALKVLRANTPVGRLVSRNTRELLRAYYKAGKMTARIADRVVADEMLALSPEERAVYEAVEDYISSTYNAANPTDRPAVGFVMTIYRRRLASSFHALRKTLEGRLKAVDAPGKLVFAEDDVPDEDEAETETGDAFDPDDAAQLAQAALKIEEKSEIQRLIDAVAALPPDSKAVRLAAVLKSLQAQHYKQVMVFTQFTDTMEFLRKRLRKEGFSVMCFSGRGGEIVDHGGTWHQVSREDTKRMFREGKAEILLCTDAAAEGLNFQFCGALVNYDMPWNPMRVEQRIGRIDRLGQLHAKIRIVNLHYERTVETDVYMALRARISLFTAVVGKLQPILSQLPRRISDLTFVARGDRESFRETLLNNLNASIDAQGSKGFDLDAITAADLETPPRPAPRVDLDALDAAIREPELLPPGVKVRPLGPREYGLAVPGLPQEIRVTTDRAFFEAHGDSTELWSPGSPVFFAPDAVATAEEAAEAGGRLMPVIVAAQKAAAIATAGRAAEAVGAIHGNARSHSK